MNIKVKFNEMKKIKAPIQGIWGVSLSESQKAFLIRFSREQIGIVKFKQALRELKTIDLLLSVEYPGSKLRFSTEKLFWTLPANELTAEFLDYWTKKFSIPTKLDDKP